MGILSILSKGIQAMINEATTPESFKIGEKFENYVRENLFVDSHYDLLERTHDFHANNKDYVLSSMKPDFKFRDKKTKKEFYIEVKFRTSIYQNKIMWCNDKQLFRYKEIHKEKPVFILLGLGDDPKAPEFISLIPMDHAKYTGLFPSYAEKFEINRDETITSKVLWERNFGDI